ncbi:MAG: hypothetical protein OXR67_05745 [Chloroflexota bacterium]|nr:hypothetical protein [Chloroflexota bacterium]
MRRLNSGNKSAGLALMGGVILSIPAFLFHPGGIFISPVDLNDFPATIAVLSDYASLTHVITMVMVLSLFLESYGFFALTRIRSRVGSLSGYALRFGVIGMLFSYGALALELGTRHMVVHIATHGVTGQAGVDPALGLPDLALTVYAAGIGLHVTFLFVSALAALCLGLGLAAHFATLNIYRIAGYGVALVGVAGLVNVVLVQHFHGVDFALLAIITNLVLLIGTIWLFIIGLGLYKGISEFEAHASADPVPV